MHLELEPVPDLQEIRGIPFAADVGFRQLIVTGPVGGGKTSLIQAIGGWPEEGYLDLTEPGWWRSRSLTFRPREVHLGFPFEGHPIGLAPFEEEFLTAPEPLRLEPERICLPPPPSGRWRRLDWRRRLVFEFILPPAEEVFEARRERSQMHTHPGDTELSLARTAQELAIYAEAARRFHSAGLRVYVRDRFGVGVPPQRLVAPQASPPRAPRGLVARVFDVLGGGAGTSARGTAGSPNGDPMPGLSDGRRRALSRLRDLLGGSLDALEPASALELLRAVNRAQAVHPHRPRASDGLAGGVVELPAELVPVIVGDLHAQLDNLLTILSEDRFLDDLEQGRAALVLLGDAVHREDDGALDEMASSVVTMDLVLRLMLAFPDRVIYLRGNHDSFSHEVTKQGVEQGQLWRAHLLQLRGERYVEEMERFYGLLPYVVVSQGFFACHAGPPVERVSRQELVDIRSNPSLMHQLTWNRMRGPGKPVGYGKREVKGLRKALGAEKSDVLIVSHSPLSEDETYWLDVGGIKRHHLVYSAHPERIAVFTRSDGEIVPLELPTQPVSRALDL